MHVRVRGDFSGKPVNPATHVCLCNSLFEESMIVKKKTRKKNLKNTKKKNLNTHVRKNQEKKSLKNTKKKKSEKKTKKKKYEKYQEKKYEKYQGVCSIKDG